MYWKQTIEILKVVVVPRFVAYPYLDDPFYDIDNQDKYVLHHSSNPLSSSHGNYDLLIFNEVRDYYSQFCKYVPFIHGSIDNDDQLLHSYNQQLLVSLFNLINKYKQSQSLITQGFNYHDYVYKFFKYHLESFPSVFKPIKCIIVSMICRLKLALEFLDRCIAALHLYIYRIQGKLSKIKCCVEKMRSCILCYVGELNNKITCYVENLIMTIICAVPKCQENGSGRRLHISLEIFKGELISSLLSKAKCLNLFHPNTGLLNQIQCDLKTIYSSICLDKGEMYKLKNVVECSESIKSEMDIFKCHLNKYIDSLTYVTCCIKEIIGMECLKNLNTIIYEMCNFECFVKSLIEKFKSSVLVIIGLVGKNISCDIQNVTVDIKCQMPSLCNIKNELSQLTCLLRNHICYIRNIICCMENTKQTTECQLRNMCRIRTEMEEMESSINMVNFFKCSNQSIHRNTIDLTNRLSGIGEHISNDGLAKSVSHTQVIGNHDKEGYEVVLTVLSNMAIVESKLVSSYLYEISKSVKETLETLQWAENCLCVFYTDWDCDKEKKVCILKSFWWIPPRIYIPNLHKKFHTNHMNREGNNICLCLIIKYLLVPNLLNCLCSFYDIINDLIMTSYRRFEKRTRSVNNMIRISKLTFFILGIIEKVVVSMEKRYLKSCRKKDCFCKQSKGDSAESKALLIEKGLALLLGKTCSETVFLFYLIYYVSLLIDADYLCKLLRCFCRCTDDPYYEYFVSIILFICNLIENIFGSDAKILDNSIQYSLNMVADYYSMDIDPHRVDLSDPSAGEKKIGYGTVNINQAFSGIVITNDMLILTLGHSKNDAKMFINETMSELSGTIKQVISTVTIRGAKFNLFYETFSAMSFKLINSGMLDVEANKSIRKTNLFLSIEYFQRARSKVSKLKELQTSREQNCVCDIPSRPKILCISISLAREKYNLISSQVTKFSIVRFLDDHSPDIYRIAGDINRITINTAEIIIKTSKNSRISDVTQKMVVSDKHEESGGSNNNYSYNDAYRINTSRAHGSLKYIIIKIVLILIIVVMTIFIRVKVETDDDYKMDNLLAEGNGMCECSVNGDDNNGRETNNGINIKYNGAKNNGTRKTSRTKGMKKKSLMIVMSVISGLYLNVVIRDLYVVLSLEYNVWSYFVSVVV